MPLINTIKTQHYYFIKNLYNYFSLIVWFLKGKPENCPAPHLVKRAAVKYIQSTTNAKIFIETGTYMGEMAVAACKFFNKVFTIEIDENLYKDVKSKFKNLDNIMFLLGDSAVILPTVLNNLDEDLVLWFDAHYSGGVTGKSEKDTPIEKELATIFEYEKRTGKKCYILVDDARCFTGENNYPTLEEVKNLANINNKNFIVKDDIIRLLPAN